MKAGPKLPPWAVVLSLVAVVAAVAFIGLRTMFPNDPKMDGHGYKILTPDDIAKYREQDARDRAANPSGHR
jgi:hypothetical protein